MRAAPAAASRPDAAHLQPGVQDALRLFLEKADNRSLARTLVRPGGGEASRGGERKAGAGEVPGADTKIKSR